MLRPAAGGLFALILTCSLAVGNLSEVYADTRPDADSDPQQLAAPLEEAIPGLLEEAGIPSMSVAVIQDGRLLWSGSYGVKRARTMEPVDENTIFEAPSLTKPFFAYPVMQMVGRGEIDRDSYGGLDIPRQLEYGR